MAELHPRPARNWAARVSGQDQRGSDCRSVAHLRIGRRLASTKGHRRGDLVNACAQRRRPKTETPAGTLERAECDSYGFGSCHQGWRKEDSGLGCWPRRVPFAGREIQPCCRGQINPRAGVLTGGLEAASIRCGPAAESGPSCSGTAGPSAAHAQSEGLVGRASHPAGAMGRTLPTSKSLRVARAWGNRVRRRPALVPPRGPVPPGRNRDLFAAGSRRRAAYDSQSSTTVPWTSVRR